MEILSFALCQLTLIVWENKQTSVSAARAAKEERRL